MSGWGTLGLGVAAVLGIGSVALAIRRCRAASRADWGRGWLNVLDGLNRLFCQHYHRLGKVCIPLPPSGPALVVANHLSGLDPLALIAASHRPLHFIIAREQYERTGLTWLLRSVGCIPVDRSANPHRALAAARDALARGEVVALFPFGRIHFDHEAELPIKPGVRHLAQLSGAPVFPVRIDGMAGAGHTVSAVWRRSRIQLSVREPVHFDPDDPDGILRTVAEGLGPPHRRGAEPGSPVARKGGRPAPRRRQTGNSRRDSHRKP